MIGTKKLVQGNIARSRGEKKRKECLIDRPRGMLKTLSEEPSHDWEFNQLIKCGIGFHCPFDNK